MEIQQKQVQMLKASGKPGRYIPSEKYFALHDFIILLIKNKKVITLFELLELAKVQWSTARDADIPCMLLYVKQDMEAREILRTEYCINRIPYITFNNSRHSKFLKQIINSVNLQFIH